MNRGTSAWRKLNEADIARLTARPARMSQQPLIKARAPGQPRRRTMNKLEAAYAQILEYRRLAGEIRWWGFEVLKLRLADSTFYDTDFAVTGVGGEIEIHETKGFWRDDARVKFKVAAQAFPFRFLAITRDRSGAWQIEEI